MKVTNVSFVLAALSLGTYAAFILYLSTICLLTYELTAAQVSASPLRVFVLAPSHGEERNVEIDSSKVASPLRWGLAAAAPGQPPMPPMMMHSHHHPAPIDNKEEQDQSVDANVKEQENNAEVLQVEDGEHEAWKPLDSDAEDTQNDAKGADEPHWVPLPGPSQLENGNHRLEFGQMKPMGPGCGGRRGGMRTKAVNFANWLRQKVGMEPIVPFHHHPHHPFFKDDRMMMGHRPEGMPGMHHGEGVIRIHHHIDSPDHLPPPPPPHMIHPHRHHHHPHPHHAHFRPHSFTGRLEKALLTLGPWEGRLVAFVIGCGIGSLLRMFFVLSVIAYRTFSRRNEEREMHQVEVIFEAVPTSPPTYSSYPVEKAPEDKSQTTTTA